MVAVGIEGTHIKRCSTIGPSESAGKNVSAPTITITPTSRPAKSGPCVGKVPAEGGVSFLAPSEPAAASSGISIRNRPASMTRPIVVLYQGVLALRPAKALPLLPAPLV